MNSPLHWVNSVASKALVLPTHFRAHNVLSKALALPLQSTQFAFQSMDSMPPRADSASPTIQHHLLQQSDTNLTQERIASQALHWEHAAMRSPLEATANCRTRQS